MADYVSLAWDFVWKKSDQVSFSIIFFVVKQQKLDMLLHAQHILPP